MDINNNSKLKMIRGEINQEWAGGWDICRLGEKLRRRRRGDVCRLGDFLEKVEFKQNKFSNNIYSRHVYFLLQPTKC